METTPAAEVRVTAAEVMATLVIGSIAKMGAVMTPELKRQTARAM